MKKNFAYILLFFVLTTSSCTQNTSYGDAVVEPAKILKSVMSFLVYRQGNVSLAEDFTALDSASNIITKETFLKLLSSGEYLPLRLISKDSSSYYKLYNLNVSKNKDIREIIKYWENMNMHFIKWKGKSYLALTLLI